MAAALVPDALWSLADCFRDKRICSPFVVLNAVACTRLLGPYAAAQAYNGKELHTFTVLPPLLHWQQFFGRPLYNQRGTERL